MQKIPSQATNTRLPALAWNPVMLFVFPEMLRLPPLPCSALGEWGRNMPVWKYDSPGVRSVDFLHKHHPLPKNAPQRMSNAVPCVRRYSLCAIHGTVTEDNNRNTASIFPKQPQRNSLPTKEAPQKQKALRKAPKTARRPSCAGHRKTSNVSWIYGFQSRHPRQRFRNAPDDLKKRRPSRLPLACLTFTHDLSQDFARQSFPDVMRRSTSIKKGNTFFPLALKPTFPSSGRNILIFPFIIWYYHKNNLFFRPRAFWDDWQKNCFIHI